LPIADLLVLASSRKPGGRCIAGYDLESDRWIRPVSRRHDGTLTLSNCRIGSDWPEVLDIVCVELVENTARPWQPENWVISDRPWQRQDHLDVDEARDLLDDLVDYEVDLLGSTDRKIAGDFLRQHPIDASLTLVEPNDLRWRIETVPWGRGRQEKAYFSLGGGHYDLQVTDPPIEAQLHELAVGTHARTAVGLEDDDDVYLTLSLTEPYEYNDDCYKLVAAVISLPRA
jgi:hypothetical protein